MTTIILENVVQIAEDNVEGSPDSHVLKGLEASSYNIPEGFFALICPSNSVPLTWATVIDFHIFGSSMSWSPFIFWP